MPKKKYKWFPVICWVYLLVLVICYVSMHVAGEAFLPTTFLLFGPRWALAVPLIILAPLALLLYRKALWTVLLSAVLVLGPMMGLTAPVPFTGKNASAVSMNLRVLALNSHKIPSDSSALAEVIHRNNPDLISIEECGPGWTQAAFGGIYPYFKCESEFAVFSKWPIESLDSQFWRKEHFQFRGFKITTPQGPIHFFCVHLASPHFSLANTLKQKTGWKPSLLKNRIDRAAGAAELRRYSQDLAHIGPCIMAGDFNLPVESGIYTEHLGDLTNAFSKVGWGYGISYHHHLTTTRIDHVLSTKEVTPLKCWTEKEVGSPHLPIVADLRWDVK